MLIITDEEKTCPRCKLSKPLTEWYNNKARKNGLSTECKACCAERRKVWYSKNSSKFHAYLGDKRRNNKKKLIEYYGGKCADCGQSFPDCVYDFHHLDPSTKDKDFGKMVTYSWARIEKEIIDKCVMLCSNCHRIRHHG